MGNGQPLSMFNFNYNSEASLFVTNAAHDPLCANMTETSCVIAISEQGGKENQHGNDERFCSTRWRCDGSI
jgi:hypothetical protein